jgi:pSer/pThr/pTyr-binding forkhead associated (FHA) protein
MQTFGKLVLTLSGGQEQEFALAKPLLALGRATINDVVLHDVKASRVHAHLECSSAGCTLVDLGSTNGTRVNGVPIQRAMLKPGDTITIGDAQICFETTALQTEPEHISIDTIADLNLALTHTRLPMTVSDTLMPRVAVHTPTKTWEIPFDQDALSIGREVGNHIVIEDPRVSRQHARIERHGESFIARDLGSTNGIWLGSQKIAEHTLQDGDTVRIGSAQLVFKRGFTSEELTLVETAASVRQGARRPIVIVPGAMGSDLWRGNECVWPKPQNLFTHPEIYCFKEDVPLEARALVSQVVIVPNLIKLEQYNRLGDYLQEGLGYERGKDLFEFPYDWRQDNRASARQLGKAIEQWKIKSPVTIIAHSMGCLVSRYYIECLGGKKQVGRLILMGGPHYGGAQALGGLLYGQGVLPFGLLGDKLRQVLITLPSVYQVLPAYPCVFDQQGQAIDILSDESWLPEAQRPLLRTAREFRRELGTRSSIPCVSIFGYGLKTITRATVHRDAQGRWEKVDFAAESAGDTTVPESSAIVEGSEIHPVQQYHGSLYVDHDVKMRLKLELTR